MLLVVLFASASDDDEDEATDMITVFRISLHHGPRTITIVIVIGIDANNSKGLHEEKEAATILIAATRSTTTNEKKDTVYEHYRR